MNITASVTFQDMPSSPSLIANIERHVEQLQRLAPRMTNCRVVVRRAQHLHHKGNHYKVSIHVALPGGELNANQAAKPNHSHGDAYMATHDAFDVMHRRMNDFLRIQHGDVKTHTNNY